MLPHRLRPRTPADYGEPMIGNGGRLTAVLGLAIMAVAAIAGTILAQPGAGAGGMLGLGTGTFAAILSVLLGIGVALGSPLAVWVAVAMALATLLGVAVGAPLGSLPPVAVAITAIGAGFVLAGVAAMWLGAVPRGGLRMLFGRFRRPADLTQGALYATLVIQTFAMVSWLWYYGALAVFGGFFGFTDFWTVPFGIGVLAALIGGGVALRPGSVARGALVAAALAGSAAAFVYNSSPDDSPVSRIFKLGLIGLALAGIALAIAHAVSEESSLDR